MARGSGRERCAGAGRGKRPVQTGWGERGRARAREDSLVGEDKRPFPPRCGRRVGGPCGQPHGAAKAREGHTG